MNRIPEFWTWRRMLVAPAMILALVVSGCSDDELTPPEAESAVAALGSMISVQQVAQSEDLLNAMESPLASAAGDYEQLGAIGDVGLGAENLGGGWTAAKQFSTSLENWRHSTRIALATGNLRERITGLALPTVGKAECSSEAFSGGVREICVEVVQGDVIRIVMTQTNDEADEHGIVELRWSFDVDTQGTSEGEDDLILSMDSEIDFADGSVLQASIRPEAPGPITDNTIIILSETIRPTYGPVSEQTNILHMDLGLLDVDDDEVIWALSSNISFRSGATNSITVSELNTPDGIHDDDQLELSAQFRAAPEDRRFESVAATIWVDVANLDIDEDDRYGRVTRTIVLDGNTSGGGIPTVFEVYDPEGWVAQGEEPAAGTFQRDASFPSGHDAALLSQLITHDVASGGSAQLSIEFSDATTFTRDISWNGAGMATLSSTHRDGTTVDGSFDDTSDSFSLTTSFPAGHDPATVVQTGSSDGNARNYTVTATYVDQSTEIFSISSSIATPGLRTVTGSSTTAAGTTSFTANHNLITGVLDGSVTGPEGGTFIYSITPQGDGTRLFEFSGDDPVEGVQVSGTILLQADGSGCGTVHISRDGASITVPVCFEADGSGTLDGPDGVISL